jgi:hypothetical protein
MKKTDVPILSMLSERKRRAQELLSTEPSGYNYYAIVGAKFDGNRIPLSDNAFVRAVNDPPNVFELTHAMDDSAPYNAVDRYAPHITYELAVPVHPQDSDITTAVAWALIATLRIRTAVEFLVPMASSHSWSTIAALERNSCSIGLLEDVPKAKRIGEQKSITADDCDWVARHFRSFLPLYEVAAFRLATDCLSTYALNANLRMSTAELWTGVESLFSVNTELRFRISALVATLLEPIGDGRLALYRRMKSLYDFRSKVVHGTDVSHDDLTSHVVEVRRILSGLLMKIIESNRLPSMDELERALFCTE